MKIWFTSDTHFGHKNILRYCNRPWGDVVSMNEGLISNWNSVIGPNDFVYHLGDFTIGHPGYWQTTLEKLNGKIHLIQGNHDKDFVKKDFVQNRMEWIKPYHELKVQDQEARNGKSQFIVLCHYALQSFNQQHRDGWNLFGHSHGSLDQWSRDRLAIDVGVDSEHTNYYPISYEQIKEIMKNKKVSTIRAGV